MDDGKSTLIGRLLHESQSICEDQRRVLEAESLRYGTQGRRVDFALLVDGLQAEREQGITIEVAYRFFATPVRRFIVADTPGHEQYTCNMATGASTADLAVILVDVRKGLRTQTERHTRIVAMMGIRHVVLAVNKMDLVAFDRRAFESIAKCYRSFAMSCGFTTVCAIPISALEGDHLLGPSTRMPWYDGPSLLPYLETVESNRTPARGPFRMAVQSIIRTNSEFRGLAGRVCRGAVRQGDPVRVLPSGLETCIKAIVMWEGNQVQAEAGDAVILTLVDELDVCRGDVLVSATKPPELADQFQARLLWMHPHDLVPGRRYLLKIHSREVYASVTNIKHRLDVTTGAHLAATTLGLNAIGTVTLSTAQPIVFEPYDTNCTLGGFVVIDPLSYETLGAGMLDFALRPAANVHWQQITISHSVRARLKNQRPCCLWFTGLSASGKSTIANLVEQELSAVGRHTYLLDGDNLRHGLNRDLGFTQADRVENIRRVAEVARLMVDAGLIVLVSLISPFRAERQQARALFADGQFVEVFVDTPIQECERRDPKGLYAKARARVVANLTGVDSPYEPPVSPDIHVQTEGRSANKCARQVLDMCGVWAYECRTGS